MTTEPLFRMEGVSKRYGGVVALADAELAIHPGRIHAVLGENGAGKSTLIKIMAGVVQPDAGSMTMDGRAVAFSSPAAASDAGIVCVFQELSLIPDLSVADNIVIRQPPLRLGMIDRRAQRRLAEEALARAGAADIHPLALVKDLPLSRRQMVEIAKALARKPRILILDEATSALTAADVEKVFAVLKRLRDEGLALVYISHRMHEIRELADECTVFRNGRNVATYAAGTRTDQEVVEMMIGREYSHVFPPRTARAELPEAVLACRNLSWTDRLRNVSFDVGRGEVVGLGGLDGQGQRELLLALFGVLRDLKGSVEVTGREVPIPSPTRARALGMALIPEDRKTEGLMLPMTVGENLSFAAFDRIAPRGVIDRATEDRLIAEMVQLLGIRTAGPDVPVGQLSGGNQQKVVIAKWLMNRPRIILLNDPTRGIDVGTKQEIYQLLRGLADAGAAILFYSTDYAELIGCCDRVLVMYDGAVIRELAGAGITERALIASALNIPETAVAGAGMKARDEGLAMKDWRYWLAEQRGTLTAVGIFVVMFVIYVSNHPAGFTPNVVQTASNKATLLAFVAIAQALVVITAGIDLSVGMVLVLTNCLASWLVVGTPMQTSLGIVAVLATGLACGALNGLIVIYGRLQPIVTTIATGAIFYGLALMLRPFPGGSVNEDLADALTGRVLGVVPAALVALGAATLLIWVPFSRSVLGRTAYAAGSSEVAAYMSGMPIKRAKFAAYTLAGLFAALGGLFLTFYSYTGEAAYASGNAYTLYSIAAVVLGGVALSGGRGSAVGAIFGALAFRTIGDLLFVFDFDPLWQPLFQGVVLALAVSLGAFGLLRVRNRLDWFE